MNDTSATCFPYKRPVADRRAATFGLFLLVWMLLDFGATSASAQSAAFARNDYPLLGNSHVAVDLNGDGKLDLAGPGAQSAAVMLGNGDGTFRPRAEFPLATWAQNLCAADLNNDGRPDLAVTLNDPNVSLAILPGNGDGTFGAPRYIANTSGADSPFVTAADLNNDGRSDLVVVHSWSAFQAPVTLASTLSVLLGNGDGTFQLARAVPVATGMLRLAVGDFNRDGVKDLAVTGSTGRFHVLLGLGDGVSFAQQTITLVSENAIGVDASDVGVADLNRDGLQDVVVVIGLNGSRTAVVLGNGDGTFRAPSILTEPQQWTPQYQAIADYNRDGNPDIALGLGYGTSGLMDVWYGNGDGTFRPPVLYLPPPALSSIGGGVLVAADFNGDARPDLALQIVGASPGLAVLVNTTGGVAPPPTPVTLAALSVSPTAVTVGGSVTGRVTLSAAPAQSVTVTLSSSDAAAAATPASVTVPAGSASATFPVTTRNVPASTAVTLRASYGGVTRSAVLTVNPATTAADTVAIQRAEYIGDKRQLRVEATSTNAQATLRVYVTYTGTLIGTLTNNGGGRYSGQLSAASNPVNITVRSNMGGSANRTVTIK